MQQAFEIKQRLARTVAHNFIETAVDMHVHAHTDAAQQRLHKLVDYLDDHNSQVDDCLRVLTSKGGADFEAAMAATNRLREFVDLMCRFSFDDLDEVVEMWVVLFPILQRTTFVDLAHFRVDSGAIRDAVSQSLELTQDAALLVAHG